MTSYFLIIFSAFLFYFASTLDFASVFIVCCTNFTTRQIPLNPDTNPDPGFQIQKITNCSKIRFFSQKKNAKYFFHLLENSSSKHDHRIDLFIFSAHFGFLGSRFINRIESGSAPASGDHTNINS
jgi:hypothetical protein